MNCNLGLRVCLALFLLAAIARCPKAVADDDPPPPWQMSPAEKAEAKAARAKAARVKAEQAKAKRETEDINVSDRDVSIDEVNHQVNGTRSDVAPLPEDLSDRPVRPNSSVTRRRSQSPYRLAADETAPAQPERVPPSENSSKTHGNYNAAGNLVQPEEITPALPEYNNNSANMAHWQDPWDINNDEVSELSPLGLEEGLIPHLFRSSIQDRFWVESDLLGWSARGMATPALVTTSPAGTPTAQAGVIGQPGTKVLVGDEEIDSQFRTGVRLDLGAWLNASHTAAVEATYISIGRSTAEYDSGSNGSNGSLILARPFFNSETGANDSQIVAYPNQSSGIIQVEATSDFQAADLAWRHMVAAGPYGRIDALIGYRCQQLTDTLSIDEFSGATGTGSSFPVGTSFHTHDEFDTHNFFNGVELGLASKYHYDRWSLDTTFKMAVGDVHSVANITGSTMVAAPGQSLASFNSGVLALPSNEFGSPHHRDFFSVVPELSTSLGWQITRRLKFNIGYTFSYWTDVARAGDQIDTRLDPRQFAPPTAPGTTPAFHMHATDYWAQGGNMGLEYRF